jgi:peptide subunit release factor 1 (eRF1)
MLPAIPALSTEPVLVVVLDHAHARYFLVAGRAVEEVACLVSPRMRGGKFHSDRRGSPGWGERGFHARRLEEVRRHYAAVARRLGGLVRAHGAGAIVIGASRRVAAEFRSTFPPALARRVVGVTLLNATAVNRATLQQAVRQALDAADRGAQRAWVGAFLDAFGKQRAVEGIRPVLEALGRNQVRALLVDSALTAAGFRGARSRRLAMTKEEVTGEPVTRVPDLVGAALQDAGRRHAPAIIVRDPRLAAQFDGMAALLRYR